MLVMFTLQRRTLNSARHANGFGVISGSNSRPRRACWNLWKPPRAMPEADDFQAIVSRVYALDDATRTENLEDHATTFGDALHH